MRPSMLLLRVAAVMMLTAVLSHGAAAQYHDSRVLQKSFEASEFFFTPSHLNPYGLEGFGPVVAGLVTDPLLDLQLSPSLAGADSSFVYLDFRTTRERSDYQDYLYYPARFDVAAEQVASTDAAYLYPWHPETTYRSAEPVVSVAIFLRPSRRLPSLTTGVTYSAITDDQAYYDVPHDIYRSSPGMDFAGEAALPNGDIPITDIYAGSDQMHTLGHFPSVYAAYTLENGWRLGARASFAQFNRDGEFGNTWNQPYSYQDVSRSSSFEMRSQSYRHTDLSVGIDRMFDDDTHGGASIGWLKGNADQVQERESLYEYSHDGATGADATYGSEYISSSSSAATWRRDGSTAHAAAFVRRRLDADRLVSLSYSGTRTSVDLSAGLAVRDSSRSESFHHDSDSYSYEYRHRSSLRDNRSGTGQERETGHRLSVGLDWGLGERSRLVLGIVGTHSSRTVESTEAVVASRYRFHDNTWNDGWDRYEEAVAEDKDLLWTFSSRTSALRLPVILWHDLSDHFQLMLGITRELADWRISDETLARFSYRDRELNGVIDSRSDFGERYREPTEYRTVVSTTGIVGITASPSESFDVRLLVSPQWADIDDTRRTQWWIGFHFRP